MMVADTVAELHWDTTQCWGWMPMRQRRDAAFTILEVLIAAMVLAIALFGLVGAFAHCAWLNANSKETTLAINGARKQMDTVRAAYFQTIMNSYDPPDDGFAVEGLTPRVGDPDGLPGRITLAQAGGVITVTILVEWRGVAGDRTVTLVSNVVNRR